MGRDYTSLGLFRQQDLRARHQFRHKGGGSLAGQNAIGVVLMGWKLLVGFVILLAMGAGALAIYGSRVEPPQKSIEQTLPDSRFPR